MGVRTARAFYLGRRRYEPIHALQKRLLDRRIAGEIGDVVLLLEHDPVVTLGRGAKPENVLFSADVLAEMGVDRIETGRGGDVTFHGPGQLVAYPIVDLKPNRCDLRRYVRELAEVMILIARDHGIEAGTVDGLVGVWADAEKPDQWATAPWAGSLAKIGAIGVRVSRWVTMHGFALNLDIDLTSFAVIVPCGIKDHDVASVASLAGRSRSVRSVALDIGRHLERAMDLEVGTVVDLEGAATEELEELIVGRSPETEKLDDIGAPVRRDVGSAA